MARTGKLTTELLGIISRLIVSSSPYVAKIIDGQLDRKTYVALNDALEAIGGKWNRTKKGHVFDEDPSEAIDALLLTGQYQTKFYGDFFQTPVELAKRMVAWAVRPGDKVLEPSAGHGRIALAAKDAGADVCCIESDPKRGAELVRLGLTTFVKDFLTLPPFLYDAVVMNPPFSRSAECAHILHAMKFVRRGGRLAAIASTGISFRETAAYKELRAAVLSSGEIEDLPAGTFSKEGTEVNTVLITWTRP